VVTDKSKVLAVPVKFKLHLVEIWSDHWSVG